jgi:sulfatase maturation enzyme AslB (radical SAM superfamily)
MKALCTAPFTAVLIDTNKGVRPCCVYEKYIGNLKTENIVSIINSNEWKQIKQQMLDNEWPNLCLSCKEREELSGGWSVRYLFNSNTFDVTGWEEEKLTYLEFNGSNICNLACLHCGPGFSSRWVADQKKVLKIYNTYDLEKKKKLKSFDAVMVHDNDLISRSTKMHLPDPELILENLRSLDLTNLRTINFKGGEPFLNTETLEILNYLDQKSILQNVNIVVSTNGTYINDEILNILKKCKWITINVSLDGINELFNYIRYGDAKFSEIEPVVAQLNKLTNISIYFQCSVMNYNAFNLLDIRNWVLEVSDKYDKVHNFAGFSNCVQSPNYLSIRTLSDENRAQLSEMYKNNANANEFEQVIKTLDSKYLGNDIHNLWVDFTNLMEATRQNNILNIVPALTNELTYK